MKRWSVWHWVSGSLLGFPLVMGCHHTSPGHKPAESVASVRVQPTSPPAKGRPAAPAVRPVAPIAPPVVQVPVNPPVAQAPVAPSVAAVEVVTPVSAVKEKPAEPYTAQDTAAEVHPVQPACYKQPCPNCCQQAGCCQGQGCGTVQPAVYTPPSKPAATPAAEPPPVIIRGTNRGTFARSEDYRWLCGRVEVSRLGQGVRLRYAPHDQIDVYGGVVTLTGDSSVRALTDGQWVAVRGSLCNPNQKVNAPAYHVDSCELVDPGK